MTDSVKREIRAAEEERNTIDTDLEKTKEIYAKYIITDQEKIKDYIAHPYVVSKRDIRKKKLEMFFNKLRKAMGL